MGNIFYEKLFSVRDKVALITGGTRGIGYMIAEGLVKAGAKVYVASRKTEACEKTQAELSKFGEISAIASDLSTIDGCSQLAEEITNREDKLDILVNNAGTTWSQPIDQFTEKAWDKVVELDVKSPFFLIQQCLPLLRKAARKDNRASVINITSINGLRPSDLQNYSYVAAKAGLDQLSKQMARDLIQEHINVNVIAPGLFKSKMTAPVFADEKLAQQFINAVPMGRPGAMEDIAGLVIFFSSKAGSYLTGATVACDGGSVTTI